MFVKCGKENFVKFCPQCGSLVEEREIDGVFRFVCKSCGKICYLNPPVVVCVVVWRRKGNGKREILLIKRGVEPERGKWALVGGFVEIGETLEDAVRRELKEEAGISWQGEIELILARHQESKRYGMVVVIGYAIEITGVDVEVCAGDDAEEVAWFDEENLPKMPFESFEEVVRKWLEK